MSDPSSTLAYVSLAIFLVALFVAFLHYLTTKKHRALVEQKITLARATANPILSPHETHPWQNQAVFNPAVVSDEAAIHLLYRALGDDGVSRIGYATSDDGITFERTSQPVFALQARPPKKKYANPFSNEWHYNRDRFASGGGWGGCEDPRAVLMEEEGRVYMTFSLFEHWGSIRMAVTSIATRDLQAGIWNWAPHILISAANQTNKNWVLFPEKINGKFAVLHALTPNVMIDYADTLEEWERDPVESNSHRGGRAGYWDAFVRGASAPPIKTDKGWLLLYHGMDPEKGPGYNVGAMLLDPADPTHILHRSDSPILEPQEWYENDWKPGVVYASGAIVRDGTLYVYYGGGDKHIGVATLPLDELLDALTHDRPVSLDT